MQLSKYFTEDTSSGRSLRVTRLSYHTRENHVNNYFKKFSTFFKFF